jgi:tetratricopeptide (TPR) repeat protein
MVGVLGLLGVVIDTFLSRFKLRWVLIAFSVALICILGARSSLWGLKWDSPYRLALDNISASPTDYIAYNDVGASLITKDKFTEAKPYILHSINIYPSLNNYANLGVIDIALSNCLGATSALNKALEYSPNSLSTYIQLGDLGVECGNYSSNVDFLSKALKKFPGNVNLLLDLALIEDKSGHNNIAKEIIANDLIGHIPTTIYEEIINNQKFTVNFGQGSTSVQI